MAVRSKWKKRRGFLKEEKKNKTQKPSIRYAAVDITTSHESRLFLSHRSPATTPDRHHLPTAAAKHRQGIHFVANTLRVCRKRYMYLKIRKEASAYKAVL
ncbi:uncharacterized protein TNIN_365251 [Trichonephila inaurata madagascariensis]|uniref:Uncharacterized protein n=1 Tax=Trichonephila inaurata madagascariensis TaxID=2747483 RepID=A0A8X6WT30_9ARAC|nr:uncharacterized protein TNIN_365251 [Trichonephila inaurata madagascariensis]